MSRAYVRLDPAYYERKLRQGYPLPAIAALVGCFCMAETQIERGRFRDLAVLRALLGKAGSKWVTFLVEHGDLSTEPDGRIYVDGWEEWQEGDWQVKERMARVRGRKRNNSSVETGIATVTSRPAGAVAGRSNGGAARPDNVYAAFRNLTGHEPSEVEHKWLDDLCHDLKRGHVLDAMYADSEPTRHGFLGRVSKQLRGSPA